MADWYNPASWKITLPGNNEGQTLGDIFGGAPDWEQSGQRLSTAASIGGSFASGQMPQSSQYGGVGSPGYGGTSSGNPYLAPGLTARGGQVLTTQLMAGQQPFFLELERQKALANWAGNLDTQKLGLAEQSLRGDIASKQQMNALDTRDVSAKRTRLGQEPGFIERAFGLDTKSQDIAEGRARDEYETNLRNLYSDATARGALTTTGAKDQRHDIAKQLWRNVEDIGVARGRSALGRERSLADVQQARSLLDTEAQKIGLTGADLQRQLDEGLKSLGLQGQVNALDLATALASADVQKVKAAQEIAQLVAGANPEQLAGLGAANPYNSRYGRPTGH